MVRGCKQYVENAKRRHNTESLYNFNNAGRRRSLPFHFPFYAGLKGSYWFFLVLSNDNFLTHGPPACHGATIWIETVLPISSSRNRFIMLSIHDSITPSSQVQVLHEFKTHISDLVSHQWTKLGQREDQHNKKRAISNFNHCIGFWKNGSPDWHLCADPHVQKGSKRLGRFQPFEITGHSCLHRPGLTSQSGNNSEFFQQSG